MSNISPTSSAISQDSGEQDFDVDAEFSKEYMKLSKAFTEPVISDFKQYSYAIVEDNIDLSEILAVNSSQDSSEDTDIFVVGCNDDKMFSPSSRRFELAVLESEKEKLLDTLTTMTSHMDEIERDRTCKDREINRLKSIITRLEKANSSLRSRITTRESSPPVSPSSKASFLLGQANELIGNLRSEIDDVKSRRPVLYKHNVETKLSPAFHFFDSTPVDGCNDLGGKNDKSNLTDNSCWFIFESCL